RLGERLLLAAGQHRSGAALVAAAAHAVFAGHALDPGGLVADRELELVDRLQVDRYVGRDAGEPGAVRIDVRFAENGRAFGHREAEHVHALGGFAREALDDADLLGLRERLIHRRAVELRAAHG